MKKSLCLLGICIASLSLFSCTKATDNEEEKPRIIITCDPELDDSNSMIRFLLHAPDFKIDGLIYTSSQVHWAGDGVTSMYRPGREYTKISKNGKPLGPQLSWRWKDGEKFIDEIIDAYAECYPNLKVHDSGYPSPEELRSVTKYGNIYFDGDYSYDSEGSELIRKAILDDEPGKLYIGAWGGCSSIARALYVIETTYKDTEEWEAIQSKVNDKVVLLLSGDQDQTYATYIKPNWPGIRQYAATNGPALGYGAPRMIPEEYRYMMEPEWMTENVTSQGPLGAYYRVWGDGRFMCPGDPTDFFGFDRDSLTVEQLREMDYMVWTGLAPKGTWISEGDTPTYTNFLDNGLMSWKDETWGGWGGRTKVGETGDNSAMFGGGSGAMEIAPQGNAKLAAEMGLNTPEGWAKAQRQQAGRPQQFQGQPRHEPGQAQPQSQPQAGQPRPQRPEGQPQARPERRGDGPAAQGGQPQPDLSAIMAMMRRGDDAIPSYFIEDLQNELAARLRWSVTAKFEDANHHPAISGVPTELSAAPGETVTLSAKVGDPDKGNALTLKWWQFKVGTYDGDVTIADADRSKAQVNIPADAKSGDTIHIVLEAADNGTPMLKRYHRTIITVK